MKGLFIVVIYSLFVLVLFCVMCFLMSTVNPLPMSTTAAIEKPTTLGLLRRVDLGDEFYTISKYPRKLSQSNDLTYGLAKVYIEDFDAKDPRLIAAKGSIDEVVTERVTFITENIYTMKLISDALVNREKKHMKQRRSINEKPISHNKTDSGAVIFRIIDEAGNSRIEIKLESQVADAKVKKNKSSSNNKNYLVSKVKDTVITIMPNNTIVVADKNDVKNISNEVNFNHIYNYSESNITGISKESMKNNFVVLSNIKKRIYVSTMDPIHKYFEEFDNTTRKRSNSKNVTNIKIKLIDDKDDEKIINNTNTVSIEENTKYNVTVAPIK